MALAEEIAAKEWTATLARAVPAGALITLLSYMLKALSPPTARILVAFMVGFVLAVEPFDHVVVSALHVLFRIWESGAVGYTDLAANIGLATGNLVGGILLVTSGRTPPRSNLTKPTQPLRCQARQS